jgi:hypothetical protein
MKNETALFSGAVLAEKAARPSPEKTKKTTNECAPQRRKRRGAQPGNSNALRHGRRSAAYLAARRALRARLRELRDLLGCVQALKLDPDLEALLVSRIEAVCAHPGRGPP